MSDFSYDVDGEEVYKKAQDVWDAHPLLARSHSYIQISRDYEAEYCNVMVYGPNGYTSAKPTYFRIPKDMRVEEILSIRLTDIQMGTQHAMTLWDLTEVDSGKICPPTATIASFVGVKKKSDLWPPRETNDRIFFVTKSNNCRQIIQQLERRNKEQQLRHEEEMVRLKREQQEEVRQLNTDRNKIREILDKRIEAQEKNEFDEKEGWRNWTPDQCDFLKIPSNETAVLDFVVCGPDAANYPRSMYFKCPGDAPVNFVLAERLRIVFGKEPPADELRVYELCQNIDKEDEWQPLPLHQTLNSCGVKDCQVLKVMETRHLGVQRQAVKELEFKIMMLESKLQLQEEEHQWAKQQMQEELHKQQREMYKYKTKYEEFCMSLEKSKLQMQKLREKRK